MKKHNGIVLLLFLAALSAATAWLYGFSINWGGEFLDVAVIGTLILLALSLKWRKADRHVRLGAKLLSGLFIVMLLAEMAEDAFLTKSGWRGHLIELGTHTFLLALLGLFWSAQNQQSPNASQSGNVMDNSRTSRVTICRFLSAGAILLCGFFVLTMAIRFPSLQKLDANFSAAFEGRQETLRFLAKYLAIIGGKRLPLLLILTALCLWLAQGWRALGMFASILIGHCGLLIFKTLIERARPGYAGIHLDSYPSGHTLIATTMAGVILMGWLARCRSRKQKIALWIACCSWPILMGASRIYIGRHYLTDVLSAWLLGSAWICFSCAVMEWAAKTNGMALVEKARNALQEKRALLRRSQTSSI